ncbi:hypothetical protein BN946_scf184985.g133 [Trametes cinnabarina]|uniref:Uncharacterized protein n=1 Tax=Pycnoporus cinnabarinus TaxID=5643 RepID=A0A060SJV4_PYCCI|nr:hypothetical protein BN946_scf184985.g133 [Trametes cinnabarina]
MRLFSDRSGLTRHVNAAHLRLLRQAPVNDPSTSSLHDDLPIEEHEPLVQEEVADVPGSPKVAADAPAPDTGHADVNNVQRTEHHPHIDGRPWNKDGNILPAGSPPTPAPPRAQDDYYPFDSRLQYETGKFLYRRTEMAGTNIDNLMDLWACSLPEGQDPPFANHEHLYATLDAIPLGDVTWEGFSVTYNGPIPNGVMPSWMIRIWPILTLLTIFTGDPGAIMVQMESGSILT